MTLERLLLTLMGADVHWKASGDGLRVDAPRGFLTPAIRKTMQQHKSELLDLACHRTPSGWTRQAWQRHLGEVADRFESKAVRRARELREWTAIRDSLDPMDLPPEWRIEWEERAAIREYDGHQAREHAEAEALREIIDRMEAGDG